MPSSHQEKRIAAVEAAEETCPRCGAARERGQEYCLECGNRILPARRAPVLAAWVAPALVALAVATAGAAAAIASTHDHKERSRTLVALSPLQPAPAPRPHDVKPPTKPTGEKLIAWPASNGYTIVSPTGGPPTAAAVRDARPPPVRR